MYREFRSYLLGGLILLFTTGLATTATSEESPSGFKTVRTSNAAILNRLGLAPLEIPDGHHKKRLAGPEPPRFSSQTRIHQPYSRHHGHRDSHVYIVKLPASPPYYTITKPHKSAKDDKVTRTGTNFPVDFQGNGKPAKIYHWNLPVVKKIAERKRLQNQLRIDQARRTLEDMKRWRQASSAANVFLNKRYRLDTSSKSHDYQNADGRPYARQKSPANKHVRNNDKRLSYPANVDDDDDDGRATRRNGDSGNKTYKLDHRQSNVHRLHLTNELRDLPENGGLPKAKKHRKKAAMSYYAPIQAKTGSTTSIHKSFPGNGKPKAFYVMEKSSKPVYYHHLLS